MPAAPSDYVHLSCVFLEGTEKSPGLDVKPTLSDKAFVGVRRQPRLAVGGLVGLLDELKLAGDLSVVEEAQFLRLVLHVLHILKVELGQNKGGL